VPVGWINSTIARTLPWVPRPLVWRISRRYIAGEDLAAAMDTIHRLNDQGISTTLDLLGEDVTTPVQVRTCEAEYVESVAEIADAGLDSGISIKLSEMGLRFDPDLCREVMERIVSAAEDRDVFVRIDMEDSSVTDATLDLYRALRAHHPRLGIVIQACLKRSGEDIDRLLGEGIANVRLCKGIYIEPAAIAWRETDDIHRAFREFLERLLEGPAEKVGIATHHPELIEHALTVIDRVDPPRERYEFQMLLGVAESLRDRLVADGHPMRVYVPYGQHWFAYSTRRLRENPQVAGHVLKNLLTPR